MLRVRTAALAASRAGRRAHSRRRASASRGFAHVRQHQLHRGGQLRGHARTSRAVRFSAAARGRAAARRALRRGRRLALQARRRARVRASNGEVFPLGIPLEVTITPLEITGGWRFRDHAQRRTLRPVRRRRLTARIATRRRRIRGRRPRMSTNASTGFTAWRRRGVPAHALAWRRRRSRLVDGAGRDRRGGVSAQFDETNLGGTSVPLQRSRRAMTAVRAQASLARSCRASRSGRVTTYGDVAQLAGRPRAARAVGNIMREAAGPGFPTTASSPPAAPGRLRRQSRVEAVPAGRRRADGRPSRVLEFAKVRWP